MACQQGADLPRKAATRSARCEREAGSRPRDKFIFVRASPFTSRVSIGTHDRPEARMSSLTICLTHDVDRVHKTYHYLTHDLRRGRFDRMTTLVTGERPYWTFDKIRSLEDRYGARSTFFFLEESIKPKWLRLSSYKLAFGRYKFSDKRVSALIRELDLDGWEIGLHGSYDSFRSTELLVREKASLERVLGKTVLGIRQHYLNLDVPDTWLRHRQAGLRYDASFGKKRAIGWRDDRYEPWFDAGSGVFILPLPLMEAFLFQAADYDVESAWKLTVGLMDTAEAMQVPFTVLWHPHMYYDAEFPGYTEIYERLLKEGAARGARFATAGELYAEAVRNDRSVVTPGFKGA
jgi:peptidoglycan/xylan/chitin deacetylase (PgdA/CDA1 family)